MNVTVMGWLARFTIVAAFVSCGQQSTMSTTKDIYTNDKETRTLANQEQLQWTVQLQGCSGSLLNPTTLITANHCSPRTGQKYKTGLAAAANKIADLKATKILESNSNLDYALVQVEWISSEYMKVQKYSPLIQTKPEDIATGTDTDPNTTALFTVGYPTDKKGAHYAVGFAKKLDAKNLEYNIGTINGNSGGSVWKTQDKMLVSSTNVGPHSYGQSGWNNNNPENPRAWNGGTRMDVIYAQSKTLKGIFPEGKNPLVNESGELIDSPQQ
ncbi:MAG: trypsin-like serine protease [Proteobacteria bacterium]|nr:trypsin-like serine protease [Pseudomonadota bacterium]